VTTRDRQKRKAEILRQDLKVARLSDEQICRRREFQLFGEDTGKAPEAKEALAQRGTARW